MNSHKHAIGCLILTLAMSSTVTSDVRETTGSGRPPGQDVPASETDRPATGGAPSLAPGAGVTRTRIRWQPWNRSSFELSARLKRPVLLYLRTSDCRLCELMERDIFADEDLVGELADSVVPMAVDAPM